MDNKNLDIISRDEINLKELFSVLWSRKVLIASITTMFAIVSISYSLLLPNIYESKALLAPAMPEDSLANKLGGYSSLAGIAGISLPADSGSKSTEAIERIKSYDFFVNQFIPHIEFKNLVAAKEWNQINNSISYDKNIFDNATSRWTRKINYPRLAKPSYQEAYEIYKKILKISEDKKTSFVSLSIEHRSPYISEKWTKLIILNINDHMRDIDKALADSSIVFLTSTSTNTNLAEIKRSISNLIEKQIQVLTLTEANKDYVFKLISSPVVPEKSTKPSRLIICILGTILGFIFSICTSLVLYFSSSRKI